jgi:hypothetical protein
LVSIFVLAVATMPSKVKSGGHECPPHTGF